MTKGPLFLRLKLIFQDFPSRIYYDIAACTIALYGLLTIITLEVQSTKQADWPLKDGTNKGFPTTNGQSLVFGLPGINCRDMEISIPSHP